MYEKKLKNIKVKILQKNFNSVDNSIGENLKKYNETKLSNFERDKIEMFKWKKDLLRLHKILSVISVGKCVSVEQRVLMTLMHDSRKDAFLLLKSYINGHSDGFIHFYIDFIAASFWKDLSSKIDKRSKIIISPPQIVESLSIVFEPTITIYPDLKSQVKWWKNE